MRKTRRDGEKDTNLALAGETVDLVEAGAGDSALQDAEILLGVDVEGLVVERLLMGIGVEEGIVRLAEVELIVDGGIHCDGWSRARPFAHTQPSRVTLPHSSPMHLDLALKALRVADLRAILAKANQQPPAKSTKADLVARILASQPAQDAYKELHEPCVLSVPLLVSAHRSQRSRATGRGAGARGRGPARPRGAPGRASSPR
jgi:hypothetical protein